MRLTVGMAAYKNPVEVWFTVQALRMYQDIKDTEILIIDNGGTDDMMKTAKDCRARYERFTDVVGTAVPRNKVFEYAQGDFVLCVDSHTMLWPRSIAQLKWWVEANYEEARNLVHGPFCSSSLTRFVPSYVDFWRANQWGIWAKDVKEEKLGHEAVEIGMMACGLFGCRKDSWLGFHPDCTGFGGVEGVIHAKYKLVGRKVLSLPFLRWIHCFIKRPILYPLKNEDRIRNYELGFDELGMDKKPIYQHFGIQK